VGDSPFKGRESVRVPGERARLILTLVFLPVTLGIVGFFFQNSVTVHSLLLVLIGAMLFVALSRGRLLGGGVRIREGQFDHVYAIVEECARTIGVETPHVFIRDDPFVPIVAVGTGDPYALVLSSGWIEAFTADELRFLVGRELAHVAAGHTKLTSLLSANGRENAVVAVAFGAWLRVIEYTADRIGLLCCGSLEVAFSAIAVSTFHHVGRKIDLHSFAEQRRELDAEPALRFGEWVGATPYATNRIARLAAFARDPLFQHWSARFAQRRLAAERPETATAQLEDRRNFAGFWRRSAAWLIDYVVVSAIIPKSGGDEAVKRATNVVVTDGHSTVAQLTPAMQAEMAKEGMSPPLVHFLQGFASGDWIPTLGKDAVWVVLAAYAVLLVGFAGQTLGMMICDLRVVGAHRERIGVGRALARYASLLASVCVVVGIVSVFRRVQPFEAWSRTRLVSGSTGGRA
jgi:Zn-dependent protease with chaperone function